MATHRQKKPQDRNPFGHDESGGYKNTIRDRARTVNAHSNVRRLHRFESYLLAKFGPLWFKEPRLLAALQPGDAAQLQDAVRQLEARGKPLTSGRVVAELRFGFWTSLLGNRYQGRFWGPAWQVLFPGQALVEPGRPSADLPKLEKKVNAILRNSRHLRNRIFHHEPIWNDRQLWSKYQDAKLLLAWISPDVASWVDHVQLDRFSGVYQQLHGLQP